MPRIASEHRVVIARPVEVVFAYMQDLSREHEWQPSILEARQLTAGPIQLGSHRRYVSLSFGRRIVSTYVVTAFHPNQQVVYETADDASIWSRWHITYAPLGETTEVAMRVEANISGFLRLLPTPVLTSTASYELTATLRRLKTQLEQHRDTAPMP